MSYFTFEQFSHSDTAKAKGIDNSVPSNLKPHAEELINTILDPLREAWGSDLLLTSAFRGEALNNAVGGSKTSAHSQAYAADLVPRNGKIEEFKQFAMKWLLNNNIQFDQYINEYSGKSSWVHIGIRNRSGQQRKQYLLYKNKTYTSINPNLYKCGDDVQPSSNESRTQSFSFSTQSQPVSNFNTGEGSTQTGNTTGLLTGKSIYLNEINWEAIKENDVFKKDESGELILDTNGNPVISDNYLFEANENESDQIDDISELPAEPIELNLDAINVNTIEQVKGIAFNIDGSYMARHSKTTREIVSLVQEWWNTVQTLKNVNFKNLKETIKTSSQKENNEDDGSETVTINAMIYMKAAFDMYGHAYREGMTCPVCGKRARFLPPGGYCSVDCLLKDVKNKSLAFLQSPNDKYAWLYDIVDQLSAILDLTNMLLNSIVLIPDIIKDLSQLPDEWKQYVQNKIAEGFVDLQEILQHAMVHKNELLQKLLKPINFGIIAKPVAMAISTIDTIRSSLEIYQDAFNMAIDTVKLILAKLTAIADKPPGLKIPGESFAWALTPRSFISSLPYTNPDSGKIFVVLPGGSGIPLEMQKPLMPSAIENINVQSIDSIIQSLFPPLTPVDYYLEPELFKIRYLFSDQSDLVMQIRQQLEDLLIGGPDYIPKFENLLPIKIFTFQGANIPLPNLGYVWFLAGLFDSWAQHSKAMVGSILNPAV